MNTPQTHKPNAATALGGKYLTFALGDEEYGIEILKVREIVGCLDITPVPRTEPHVRGVVNLRGQVISVAPLPSTAEGMRRVLRNDQLVQQLVADGAPIEVRVALDRSTATPSGFAWSASSGPKARPSAGSIVQGQVVVDRTRLIRWLVPGSGD